MPDGGEVERRTFLLGALGLVGCGDGTTFPLAGSRPGDNRANMRVIYVAPIPQPIVDLPPLTDRTRDEELIAGNFSVIKNPKPQNLNACAWVTGIAPEIGFVAVGSADAT